MSSRMIKQRSQQMNRSRDIRKRHSRALELSRAISQVIACRDLLDKRKEQKHVDQSNARNKETQIQSSTGPALPSLSSCTTQSVLDQKDVLDNKPPSRLRAHFSARKHDVGHCIYGKSNQEESSEIARNQSNLASLPQKPSAHERSFKQGTSFRTQQTVPSCASWGDSPSGSSNQSLSGSSSTDSKYNCKRETEQNVPSCASWGDSPSGSSNQSLSGSSSTDSKYDCKRETEQTVPSCTSWGDSPSGSSNQSLSGSSSTDSKYDCKRETEQTISSCASWEDSPSGSSNQSLSGSNSTDSNSNSNCKREDTQELPHLKPLSKSRTILEDKVATKESTSLTMESNMNSRTESNNDLSSLSPVTTRVSEKSNSCVIEDSCNSNQPREEEIDPIDTVGSKTRALVVFTPTNKNVSYSETLTQEEDYRSFQESQALSTKWFTTTPSAEVTRDICSYNRLEEKTNSRMDCNKSMAGALVMFTPKEDFPYSMTSPRENDYQRAQEHNILLPQTDGNRWLTVPVASKDTCSSNQYKEEINFRNNSNESTAEALVIISPKKCVPYSTAFGREEQIQEYIQGSHDVISKANKTKTKRTTDEYNPRLYESTECMPTESRSSKLVTQPSNNDSTDKSPIVHSHVNINESSHFEQNDNKELRGTVLFEEKPPDLPALTPEQPRTSMRINEGKPDRSSKALDSVPTTAMATTTLLSSSPSSSWERVPLIDVSKQGQNENLSPSDSTIQNQFESSDKPLLCRLASAMPRVWPMRRRKSHPRRKLKAPKRVHKVSQRSKCKVLQSKIDAFFENVMPLLQDKGNRSKRIALECSSSVATTNRTSSPSPSSPHPLPKEIYVCINGKARLHQLYWDEAKRRRQDDLLRCSDEYRPSRRHRRDEKKKRFLPACYAERRMHGQGPKMTRVSLKSSIRALETKVIKGFVEINRKLDRMQPEKRQKRRSCLTRENIVRGRKSSSIRSLPATKNKGPKAAPESTREVGQHRTRLSRRASSSAAAMRTGEKKAPHTINEDGRIDKKVRHRIRRSSRSKSTSETKKQSLPGVSRAADHKTEKKSKSREKKSSSYRYVSSGDSTAATIHSRELTERCEAARKRRCSGRRSCYAPKSSNISRSNEDCDDATASISRTMSFFEAKE